MATVHLYFATTIEQEDAFQEKGLHEGQKNGFFAGISGSIWFQGGEWVFKHHDAVDPIPETAAKHIARVSLHDSFSGKWRESGIYGGDKKKFDGARGHLDWGSGNLYSITIHGETFEGVVELYETIRAGRITPSESWYNSQLIKSSSFLKFPTGLTSSWRRLTWLLGWIRTGQGTVS